MTDRTPPSDTEARLNRWVRTYAPALLGFLTASLRDRHRAEDLLQDVFCRAWEARNRYTEAGLERAYLWRIADRLARDHHRSRRREAPVDAETWSRIEPADDTLPGPDGALRRTEMLEQLHSAMNAVTEAQRRTLLLRYYGQLEFHEIAAILELPLNTVLSHARRGLAALRRVLVEETP
ncbi:MAG TPA: RNA polymerase sigma factor [Pirellulales bacterium]|jgi:RNA polymerase sigma-70 factor (ECF subfamily)|nr:RNA polymerase sigma factor [Pirellulales bacterium]